MQILKTQNNISLLYMKVPFQRVRKNNKLLIVLVRYFEDVECFVLYELYFDEDVHVFYIIKHIIHVDKVNHNAP